MQVSSDPANDWEPALAASPDGRVTVVWDTYAKGSYDVVARTLERGKLGPLTPIASTGAFEARASAQYDRQGRLWIAWDESDWNWGKDYGNAIPESGRGLLTRRQARVAVLANGKLMQPAASIAKAIPADFRQVFHQPRTDTPASSHPAEVEDVARARAYRAKAGASEFRIARGDIHRHTDISWDGNRDGSLNDAYRYALDAVAFDYMGVCDHQAGQSIPYNWWMIQKAVDLYTVPGKFTPLYSYERSLLY